MLVGNAGVGNRAFLSETLASLSEDYTVSHVPFNYYTTSAALQSECPFPGTQMDPLMRPTQLLKRQLL